MQNRIFQLVGVLGQALKKTCGGGTMVRILEAIHFVHVPLPAANGWPHFQSLS